MAEAGPSKRRKMDEKKFESSKSTLKSVGNLEFRTLKDMIGLCKKEEYVVAIEFRNRCKVIEFIEFDEEIIQGDAYYEFKPSLIAPGQRDAVMYFSTPPTPGCSGIVILVMSQQTHFGSVSDGTTFSLAWEMRPEGKNNFFGISFDNFHRGATANRQNFENILKEKLEGNIIRGVSGDELEIFCKHMKIRVKATTTMTSEKKAKIVVEFE